MGATSVTGVGPGAADGNKGPGNGRSQFVPLLTPHVIAADTVTLSGTTFTVTFPTALPEASTEYSVILTGVSTTEAYVSTKTDVSSEFTSFVITGGSGELVDYIVVQHGVA